MRPRELYDEPSGTVATDDIVSGLVASCTSCGRPHGGVWAQVITLGDSQHAIHLCKSCHTLPQYGGYNAALGRLRQRYGR